MLKKWKNKHMDETIQDAILCFCCGFVSAIITIMVILWVINV